MTPQRTLPSGGKDKHSGVHSIVRLLYLERAIGYAAFLIYGAHPIWVLLCIFSTLDARDRLFGGIRVLLFFSPSGPRIAMEITPAAKWVLNWFCVPQMRKRCSAWALVGVLGNTVGFLVGCVCV